MFSSRLAFAENPTGRWLQNRQNVCVKNQQVTEVAVTVGGGGSGGGGGGSGNRRPSQRVCP